MRVFWAILMVLSAATPVAADPARGSLDGVVTDAVSGGPVFGATIALTAGGREVVSIITDESGHYTIPDLAPGSYALVVAFGGATAKHGNIAVRAGEATRVSDSIDASGETITIQEHAPPTEPSVPARPTYDSVNHPLPYSDQAVDEDVWGLAWVLLDVDPTGRVVSLRFLKRPGHGLDDIATKEAFRLKFTPALDAQGKPIAAKILWKMEWESYSRKVLRGATATDTTIDTLVPCAGTAPLNLDSAAPVYRDCSKPDYKAGAREPLIRAPLAVETAAGAAPTATVSAKDVAIARKTYQSDCKSGDAEGCFNLSILDERAGNRASARELEQQACTGGAAKACFSLGIRLVDGREHRDPQRAATLFDKACRGGDERGCDLTRLRAAHPGDLDAQVTTYLRETSCSQRDLKGCYNLAVERQAADPSRAMTLYQRACDGGIALACSNLGLMVEHWNARRAATLFERACDGGEALGCTNLGQLYMSGEDLPRDPARARPALEKACTAGEAVGCYDLAIMTEWGMGAKADADAARTLYAKACAKGYAKACEKK